MDSLAGPADETLTPFWAGVEDRWRPERALARGAVASVWVAQDLRHPRLVAVKILEATFAEAVGRDRFLREIEFLARLQHPNILPLLDSGEAAGRLYFVMPYVEAESLRRLLERQGRLPIADAVELGAAVADALDHAHRKGIVHRDVKPENILMADGRPLLCDFGISLEAAGQRITAAGLAVGTPAYMSPEQVSGSDDTTERSDIYSLGCVIYECLAGQPPFTGPDARAVMARHAIDPVPSLRALRPEVPESVERAVATALAKAPQERFTPAAALAAALRDGNASRSGEASGFRDPAPRRRLGVAAVLLCAAALGAWWLVPGRAPSSATPPAGQNFPVVQRQITNRGDVQDPALSPAGDLVAYRARGSLWTLDPSNLEEVEVVKGGVADWETFAWNGNGSALLMAAPEGLFAYPRSGGQRRLVLPFTAAPFDTTGRTFVYRLAVPRGVATFRGSFVGDTRDRLFSRFEFLSEDGTTKAFDWPQPTVTELDLFVMHPRIARALAYDETHLWLVDFERGAVTPLLSMDVATAPRADITGAAWYDDDGRRIALAITDSAGSRVVLADIETLPQSLGSARVLYRGDGIRDIAVGARGQLFFRREIVAIEIARLEFTDRGVASVPVTDAALYPAPSASGDSVFFKSVRGRQGGIYLATGYSDAVAVLLGLEAAGEMQLSPDGRFLLFDLQVAKDEHFNSHPATLELANEQVREWPDLTSRSRNIPGHQFAWQRDSRGFYAVVDTGFAFRGLVSVRLDSNVVDTLLPLTQRGLYSPILSRDGQRIALARTTGAGQGETVVWRVDRAGHVSGERSLPQITGEREPLRWTAGGDIEYFSLMFDPIGNRERNAIMTRNLMRHSWGYRFVPDECQELTIPEQGGMAFCTRFLQPSDLWLVEGLINTGTQSN